VSRDRRACRDPLARLARSDLWVRQERTADLDLLVRRARRALPDSLGQQDNLECLGHPARPARWARTVATACRVLREQWDRMASRVSLVLRALWVHRESQDSQGPRASTACLALPERPVSGARQVPTGLAGCQDPTAPRVRPARLALLVLRAHPARPVPRAPQAHMDRGTVTTTAAECCVTYDECLCVPWIWCWGIVWWCLHVRAGCLCNNVQLQCLDCWGFGAHHAVQILFVLFSSHWTQRAHSHNRVQNLNRTVCPRCLGIF